MILVTGGARSGKSTFAENLAANYPKKILYLATAIPFDEEMKQRIKKHQDRRPKAWDTYEGYLNLAGVLTEKGSQYRCILLDCVTILITNLLFHFSMRQKEDEIDFEKIEPLILQEINQIISAAKKITCQTIFVTNETGLGIVPENRLSRHFRDIAGRANQILAQNSEEVYFLVSGIPVKIKGEKIT